MTQPLPVTAEPIIEPPIPPTRKFNPILILVAVVLLVVVGAGGIFLGKSLNTSQTPNESASQQNVPAIITPSPSQLSPTDSTAGRKLYKYDQHKEYSYEIRYPSDWILNAPPDISGALVNFGNAWFQSPGKSFIYSRVTLLRSGGFSFKDEIENAKEFLTSPQEDNLIMQGLNAKRLIGYSTQRAHPNPDFVGSYSETVYIPRNSGENIIIYEISLFQTPKEDHLETFRQILSTFKFLDQG